MSFPRVLEQGQAICHEELDNFQNATMGMVLDLVEKELFITGQQVTM